MEDVIELGPNSKECLDLIINNHIKLILGNHELYYLNGTEIEKMSDNIKIKYGLKIHWEIIIWFSKKMPFRDKKNTLEIKQSV